MLGHKFLFLIVISSFLNSLCTIEQDKVNTYCVLGYIQTARNSGIETAIFRKTNGDTIVAYLKELNDLDNGS